MVLLYYCCTRKLNLLLYELLTFFMLCFSEYFSKGWRHVIRRPPRRLFTTNPFLTRSIILSLVCCYKGWDAYSDKYCLLMCLCSIMQSTTLLELPSSSILAVLSSYLVPATWYVVLMPAVDLLSFAPSARCPFLVRDTR